MRAMTPSNTQSAVTQAAKASGRALCLVAAVVGFACDQQAQESIGASAQVTEPPVGEQVEDGEQGRRVPSAEVSYLLSERKRSDSPAARLAFITCTVILQPRQAAGTPDGIAFRFVLANSDSRAVTVEWPAAALQIQLINEAGWPVLPLILRGPVGHGSGINDLWELAWISNEDMQRAPCPVRIEPGGEEVFRVTVPRALANPVQFAAAQRESRSLGAPPPAESKRLEAVAAGRYTLRVNLLLVGGLERDKISIAALTSEAIAVELEQG